GDDGTAVTPSAATPANRVRVNLVGTVTPAILDTFTAQAEGAGIALEWKLISEYQNAGFNVYRRASGSEDWMQLNAGLIAGRMTDASAKTYRYYDWAPSGSFEYKLESVAIDGAGANMAQASAAIDAEFVGALSDVTLQIANSAVVAEKVSERAAALSAQLGYAQNMADAAKIPLNEAQASL